MKAGKLPSLIISLLFLGMLAMPTLLELSGGSAGTASIEKRALAPWPDSRLLFRSFPDYAAQLKRYYSDSFGLRDRLIRWNNLLRLSLFDESPVSGVRVGRDGWLFYANEFVLEDYEQVMPYSPEDLERMTRILDERLAWLDRRGIKLFVIIAPNKHTVYSEYLPPAIHKIGKESRLDQVATALKSRPDIEFIDVREALQKAKPAQRLYHRTDTHWNDYGALIAYGELMDRIERHFPNVRKLALDDYDVSVSEGQGGDLAGMLSLSDFIKEERITLVPRFTPKAGVGMRPYADPVDPTLYPGREMVVKETGNTELPRAFIFRDSFAWPLIPLLGESFNSSVFVWTFDFLPEILEQEKPDIVILECVERYINCLTLENPLEVKRDGER